MDQNINAVVVQQFKKKLVHWLLWQVKYWTYIVCAANKSRTWRGGNEHDEAINQKLMWFKAIWTFKSTAAAFGARICLITMCSLLSIFHEDPVILTNWWNPLIWNVHHIHECLIWSVLSFHFDFVLQGQWMNIVTCTYWQGYLRLSIREGLMLWSCIMAVPLPLTHLLYRRVLAKKFTTKYDHLPYLINLVLCYFWLLPKLEAALKGHVFSVVIVTQGHVLFKVNTCSQQLLCLFMYSFQQHFSLDILAHSFFQPISNPFLSD